MDDVLIKAVQEMAEEKPLVADVSVQTEEQETPVTDASVKTEAELSNEQALRG